MQSDPVQTRKNLVYAFRRGFNLPSGDKPVDTIQRQIRNTLESMLRIETNVRCYATHTLDRTCVVFDLCREQTNYQRTRQELELWQATIHNETSQDGSTPMGLSERLFTHRLENIGPSDSYATPGTQDVSIFESLFTPGFMTEVLCMQEYIEAEAEFRRLASNIIGTINMAHDICVGNDRVKEVTPTPPDVLIQIHAQLKEQTEKMDNFLCARPSHRMTFCRLWTPTLSLLVHIVYPKLLLDRFNDMMQMAVEHPPPENNSDMARAMKEKEDSLSKREEIVISDSDTETKKRKLE